jgi:hypothetical protein
MGVSKWMVWFSVVIGCAGAVAWGCGSSDNNQGGGDAGSDAEAVDGATNDAVGETATSDSSGIDGAVVDSGGVLDGGSAVDSGGDAATADSPACTPVDASIAAIAAGPVWGCFQAACASQLTACATDCVCNDAMLRALECAANGESSTTCFEDALAQNARDSNVMLVGGCLESVQAKCSGGADAGGDARSGADGSGGADATSDGPSEATDGAGEAAATQDSGADGSDAASDATGEGG